MITTRNLWGMVAVLTAVAIVLTAALEDRPQGRRELDGYRSQFFDLTRIDIPDRTGTVQISFVVPVGWESGLTYGDNFWLADPDANYIVQRTAAGRNITAGEEEARQSILDDLRRGPKGTTTTIDQRIYTASRYTIFESATDMEYDGERVMAQHLFRVWPENGVMYAVGFHIIVRGGRWERPETADIIELFRAQLLQAHIWAAPSVQDNLRKATAGARFNLRDLVVVRPYGFMSINLPKSWREHIREDAVGYYDPARNSGALWIGYQVLLRDHQTRLTPGRKVDRERCESRDPQTECLRWRVKDTTEDRSLIVLVDLVLDEGQADDPEFKELILILDEEIRRMRIGLPPSDAKAIRETGRPPVQRGRL